LLKLGAITDNTRFKEAAAKTLQLFTERMQQLPQAVPLMMHALDYYLEEPRRVVIVGEPEEPLLSAAHSVYQPHKVILSNRGPVELFARTLPKSEETTAYVCTGTACKPPTTKPEEVLKFLREK
jgi:uncharacterized protein YyaL (SSP411 family)